MTEADPADVQEQLTTVTGDSPLGPEDPGPDDVPEADSADLAEQARDAEPPPDPADDGVREVPLEASEADVLEQSRVARDDEGERG